MISSTTLATNGERTSALPLVALISAGDQSAGEQGRGGEAEGGDVGEIEARARAVIGGAAHFDAAFANEQPTCAQCSNPFERRQGSGGKAQRFCSETCRKTWHAAHPKPRTVAPSISPETVAARVVAAVEATRAAANPPPERFDWMAEDRESVILHKQPCTAVYWNRQGQIVIRQEAEWNDDDDPFLHFDPQNLPALIARLQAEYDSWQQRQTRGR